ncbi:MAG: GyrI-like domain-containing protein [Treponema sp.]
MTFDYKKEYKEFYLPPKKPQIITIPKMNFIAVRGKGNPNDEDGDYKKAIAVLYGIAFTVKMSKKGNRKIDGYFDYVVPPLEGLWEQDGIQEIDYSRKNEFKWISMIRLPDFVTEADFLWAKDEAQKKKGGDFSTAEFFSYNEGLCVQCMHTGTFDDEPATVQSMHDFLAEQNYALDITSERLHHEIYLSDFRRTSPEKLRTVIRHPIRRK